MGETPCVCFHTEIPHSDVVHGWHTAAHEMHCEFCIFFKHNANSKGIMQMWWTHIHQCWYFFGVDADSQWWGNMQLVVRWRILSQLCWLTAGGRLLANAHHSKCEQVRLADTLTTFFALRVCRELKWVPPARLSFQVHPSMKAPPNWSQAPAKPTILHH